MTNRKNCIFCLIRFWCVTENKTPNSLHAICQLHRYTATLTHHTVLLLYSRLNVFLLSCFAEFLFFCLLRLFWWSGFTSPTQFTLLFAYVKQRSRKKNEENRKPQQQRSTQRTQNNNENSLLLFDLPIISAETNIYTR